MLRFAFMLIWIFLPMFIIDMAAGNVVVADEVTRKPLPGASVFDRTGAAVCISDSKGRLPSLRDSYYPITVRYLGFKDRKLTVAPADTVFLQEDFSELPEVVVETRSRKLLHILAYIREYSTMTTYTDTVFLFREKMVDYMLPTDRKMKFRGWTRPRVLACRSYYRFTDDLGLDSVSDESGFHFSWSDWVGIPPAVKLPPGVRAMESGTDTIRGRYGWTEIWRRDDDRVTAQVDVLSDKTARSWVPEFSGFFRSDLDFERFRVKFDYDNVEENEVTPFDLTGYSFIIESNGRGHNMFRFNRAAQPFFVATRAEAYILDREYISVKEARQWERRHFSNGELAIYEPLGAPELEPWVISLMDRVRSIDKEGIRLDVIPDRRLGHINPNNHNFRIGHRALYFLKWITGISHYKTKKNLDNRWNNFTREQKRRRKQSDYPVSGKEIEEDR